MSEFGVEYDGVYPEEKATYWEVIWRLLGYIRKHYKRTGAAYLFNFIQTPLELALPYYHNSVIAQALHSTSDDYDFQRHMQTIGFVILLTILNMGMYELRSRFLGDYVDVIDDNIKNDLFKAIVNRDIFEFDKYGAGTMSDIMENMNSLAQFILYDLPGYVKQLISFPGSLLVMYSISPILTAIVAVGIPLLAVLEKYKIAYQRDTWAETQMEGRGRDAKTHIFEVLNTIKNVRSFGCQREEVRTVRQIQDEQKQQSIKLSLKEKALEAIYDTISTFLQYVTVFYGGYMVRTGSITVETFLSFQSYQVTFEMYFDCLRSSYSTAIFTVESAQKAFAFMDKKHKVPIDGVLRPVVLGEIKLENVNFTYETRPDNKVLEDFNLHIKAGESIALVGPSGGGKSTIISLIERFYGPDSGSIIMDGISVEEYDDEYYHKQIALVAQESILYDRSIRENILYGCDWATEEQMIEAAKMANAHDFVSALKDGYSTSCGYMGTQLSGGQKQRIAIARAIVRQPSVLLLDEATSALDTESESVVQEALDRCCKDRTVIVIAHRLSTIRNVDKIAVMKGGRVSEFGTHSHLMKIKGGLYANLVDHQLKGFVTSTIEDAIEEIEDEKLNDVYTENEEMDDEEMDDGEKEDEANTEEIGIENTISKVAVVEMNNGADKVVVGERDKEAVENVIEEVKNAAVNREPAE